MLYSISNFAVGTLYSTIISGDIPNIKAMLLQSQLTNASKLGCISLVISFDKKHKLEGMVGSCGYSSVYSFEAEKDTYRRSFPSLVDEIRDLSRRAQFIHLSADKSVDLNAVFEFLINLDCFGAPSFTVSDLLDKFRNLNRLNPLLFDAVCQGKLTRSKAADIISRYKEIIGAGITADNLIADIKLRLRGNNANEFSLCDLRAGQACVLYTSDNTDDDTNLTFIKQWTDDIVRLSENNAVFVVIKTDNKPHISELSDAVEKLSGKANCCMTICAKNFFADGAAMKDKAISLSELFRYNIFGAHNPTSAEIVSSLFGSSYKQKITVAEVKNHRIFGESFTDRFAHTDKNVSKTISLEDERKIRPEVIENLRLDEFIVYDTKSNEYRFSIF
jgi:hypothetical protein